MILSLWSYDWYYYMMYLLIGLLLYNFNWNSDGILKYTGNELKLMGFLSRSKYKHFQNVNKYLQNSLNMMVLIMLIILLMLLMYWNGFSNIYNTYQVNMKNLVWFYYVYLMYLFIMIFLSFKNMFSWYMYITDLSYSIMMLFIIFFFFLNLNNLFMILFLIECQSIFVIYLLITVQQLTSVNIENSEYDMYKCLMNRYYAQLSLLFLQFWIMFISAVLLTFVILWFSNVLGSISWLDMNYLSYFYILKLGLNNYFVMIIMGLMFLLSLFLKIGIFPFHFWKPDFYKNLNLWGMMWYLVIFTFVLLFFMMIMCSMYLENNMVCWQILIYMLQMLSLMVLMNIMFIVTEMKVFMAYMSVFHMSYMLLFFMIDKYKIMMFSMNYLIMYIIIMIFFFFMMLSFKNKEMKFLTDFTIMNQVYMWGCLMMSSLMAMSGIPPFIGFWLKMSLIMNLMYVSKFLLVVVVFITGVYLMYFYVQNYSFIGSHSFTWNYVSMGLNKNYNAVYMCIIVCFFMNMLYAFFMNDMLNYISLMNLVAMMQW